ncbi:hypothetical protein C21_04110 [Arenibacter sp. NBRC 103722]|nr:hypothetical protein C21_04110 [Arenibacter sp. NBRC 103722]
MKFTLATRTINEHSKVVDRKFSISVSRDQFVAILASSRYRDIKTPYLLGKV